LFLSGAIIMIFKNFRICLVRRCLTAAGLCMAVSAFATGVQPDTTLLVISEASGGQMGVKNTDNQPLLLHTTIIDLPDSKGVQLHAIPPVTRLEPNGYQIVRFVLEKPDQPLTVQVLKRVRFEGIPPTAPKGSATVRMSVGQDLPVVISPKGLEQVPEPWKLITWSLVGDRIVGKNPSPYVARMSQEVTLQPSGKLFKLLERPYMLPGDSIEMALPSGVNQASVTGFKLTPGSPFGFAMSPYEVTFKR
jgi:P pilus assembly chaperone PapD